MINVIDTIAAAFADFDAQHVADQLAWAERAQEALRTAGKDAVEIYRARCEATNQKYCRTTATWIRFEAEVRVAGSKTWRRTLTEGNAKAAVVRDAENRAEARNIKIAKALAKAGINAIEGVEVVIGDGVRYTILRAGGKTVKVETIVAGGYNIVRAHYRTITHVYNKAA